MAEDSGEAIARVVADLRMRNVSNALKDDEELFTAALNSAGSEVVIDATDIYKSIVSRDDPIYVYEDHPCVTPPWKEAAICYVNEHGNAVVMSMITSEWDKPEARWDTENIADWSQIHWISTIFVWCGGRTRGTIPVVTGGPLHCWRLAINPDGSLADVRWVQLRTDQPLAVWDMAQLVLLGALNFLNCHNVAIAEPVRTRAVRRRIQRAGVTVSEIQVFKPGPLRRKLNGHNSGGVPLSSVRGHFAHYGPQYNRGLLFGKIAGRFWIPQHAIGSSENGEKPEAKYRLRP